MNNSVEHKGEYSAKLILKGTWLYDQQIPMHVQIFAINYDLCFEMYKEEGGLQPGDVPELNGNNEQFVIAWHNGEYFSFAGSTAFGGLSLLDAINTAEKTVKQKIQWQTAC